MPKNDWDFLQEPEFCRLDERLLGCIVIAAIAGLFGGFIYGLLRFIGTTFFGA